MTQPTPSSLMTATASDPSHNIQRHTLDTTLSLPIASSSRSAVPPRKQTRFPVYPPDTIIPRSKTSQSEDVSHKRMKKPSLPRSSRETNERTPLLRRRDDASGSRPPIIKELPPKSKKPFYRARPLWLVPFAIAAALVRGMTLAPRVEVYTQLSCYALHGRHQYNTSIISEVHIDSIEWDSSSAISLYASLDPLGPNFFTSPVPRANVSGQPPIPDWQKPPSSSRHKRRNSSDADQDEDDSNPDPRRLPSARCLSDPAVQANAARLQMVLTTTMGLLSALTTGWWGHFGERYGRTKVLAVATFGLFWTDLLFVLTSTPNLPFPLSWLSYTSESNHARHLLFLAPLVEGLLGGWSTLQSATSAYISDCTSPGSRAQIFSRFTGVFYLGFSVGPAIAAWLIHHPNFLSFPSSSNSPPGSGLVDLLGKTVTQRQSVTAVFWIAIICSFTNFMLVLFVFPESLSQEKREQARQTYEGQHTSFLGNPGEVSSSGYNKDKALDLPVTGVEDADGVGIGAIMDVNELSSPILSSPSSSRRGFGPMPSSREASVASTAPEAQETVFMYFLKPLRIFLPVYVDMPSCNGLMVKRKKDYSLTLLAASLFAWMLSTGVYQIKYLYVGHTYRWGAEQLSYFISFMGGARAMFLLVLLPFLIATFKSKPKPESQVDPGNNGKGKGPANHEHRDGHDVEANDSDKGKKHAPTRLQLGKAIRFDLRLTRISLMIDIFANILVAIAPSPTLSAHATFAEALGRRSAARPSWSMTRDQSQRLFVFASGLNSFASGMVPAVHSLALCIVQARTLDPDFGIGGHSSEGDRNQSKPPTAAPVDTGTLFGAFAVLQAVGQMILGPLLFGIIYSETVALHPKSIFVVATGLLMFALVLVLVVQNPVGEIRLERKDKKFKKRMEEGYGAFGVVSPGGSGFRYIGGGKRKGKGRNWEEDIERRGRPRNSKDLRGGAIGWYCTRDEDNRNDHDRYMTARSA